MMGTFRIDRLDPWVINLDHRTDRWAAMQPELVRAGLSDRTRRLSAFTKDDWHEPEASAPLMSGKKTLGNWLSHTFLMRTAVNTDRDVLVLEDDVFFAEDFRLRMRIVEDELPDDWDILFLCGTFHAKPAVWHRDTLGRDVETTACSHLLRAYGVWSNHAYVVRGRSAPKILGLMRSVMRKARGSDHALILIQPRLNAYVFVPGMVFQADGTTDVGEGGERTEFSGFLKLGPYVYQDRLEGFDPAAFDWGEADVRKGVQTA
jgi:GR25 family glycosyltransferase involved in LPS biosynthesis